MVKPRKLVLEGTNDVEVEIAGVELKISGAFASSLESGWAPIDPEGLMPPDDGWEIWGLAQFFRVVGITPRDDGSATLELVHLSKSGRVVGAPLCLEGVSFAEAVELQDRLRALAEAPAIEVPVEQLFADPERFHGQKLRLEWVGATVKLEGNRLWRYGGDAAPPPIWHDLELLPGSYEVVVEGVLRYKPEGGFGHLGRSLGDFTVVDLVDSRPAGETLARLVRDRVFDLVRARWRELVPATAALRPALSPPFPRAWPSGGEGRLVYYAYASSADDALGLQLAAGQELGTIWAAVTVDALGHDAPGLELLAPGPRGEAAGASASLDEPLRLSEGWLELAGEGSFGELFHAARAARGAAPTDAALDAVRQLYAAWLACFAPVAAPIATRHSDFIAWLAGSHEGA
jgi:hypothetical protein